MKLLIDNEEFEVSPGTTVAAAVMLADRPSFRRSATGAPRFPLCGMGICFECRVTIDGVAHVRSCQIEVSEGMVVETE